MTLEEAIKHCEKVAENQEQCAEKIDKLDCDSTSMRKCASEHRQLAEWLRELKMFKDLEAQGYAMYKISEVMQNDSSRVNTRINIL